MSRTWTGGHSSPVLCAGVSEKLVATGAESGELTVWNHDGSPLSKLHVRNHEDVTCVEFSSSTPCALYASHGQNVSVFDPRNLGAPVTELQDVGEDEINSLSVNETGGALAAADDSGVVKIVDLKLEKVSRTLRKHANICSSVKFRPQRPDSFVSAGLDMQVMLWNLPKVRPVWTCALQDTSDESAQQIFNPPLVHCVDVASCGDVFACAAEDGRVHLLRVSADSRLRERGAFKAHAQGASQARFLNFLSHPFWLATGGNDGLVALWDLSQNPVAINDKKFKTKRTKARAKAAKQPKDDGDKDDAGPKLCFNHEDKVNWLCPTELKGKASILVADQSPSLTVYSLENL